MRPLFFCGFYPKGVGQRASTCVCQTVKVLGCSSFSSLAASCLSCSLSSSPSLLAHSLCAHSHSSLPPSLTPSLSCSPVHSHSFTPSISTSHPLLALTTPPPCSPPPLPLSICVCLKILYLHYCISVSLSWNSHPCLL